MAGTGGQQSAIDKWIGNEKKNWTELWWETVPHPRFTPVTTCRWQIWNLNPNCAAFVFSFHFKGCLTTVAMIMILLRQNWIRGKEFCPSENGNWSKLEKGVIATIESQLRRAVPSTADGWKKENLLTRSRGEIESNHCERNCRKAADLKTTSS